jgi:MFS family permease
VQVGVLNTALPFISKDLHYHKDDMLSSAIVLGAAAGAITAGKLADVLGPRHAQVCACRGCLAGLCMVHGVDETSAAAVCVTLCF